MTIDERIDRLTERHEALTQFVELTAHEWNREFKELSQIVRQSAASIDTLARIAEFHEHRLDELEGA